MKTLWMTFILIITIGLTGFVAIIYKCFVQKPKPVIVYLSTDQLTETTIDMTDSTNRPNMVSVFACNKTNTAYETTPWADVYFCRLYDKRDSLSGDTAIILLDIQTRNDLQDIENINHFAAYVKSANKFKKCRVMVPANFIDKLKKCRYKFGKVKLVDDWGYE